MSEAEQPKARWEPMGGEVVQPAVAQRQAKHLMLLRDLLEEALKAKQGELERAQMALIRLKHGGGL
ncbi:MAG: hypothetical protein A2Y38_01560 [Spirochaetes bacterium GWB1_59_5]|nr:MAG: hypothetical protein A2Y38_01560 [Spirochaetes bacterium GWB1_59_5]